jgi:hypothetical protein
MEMDRFRDAQYQQRFAQIEQRAMGAVRAQQYASAEKDAESFVRDEFPEAYDARTNLHKAGYQVYHSMPELQMRGDGFRIATEIAAAREGILPKSKRRTEPTVSRSDVQAQSIERGTKRPPKDGDGKEDATLTPREKAMAARGGVDEATFKKAKAARAAGKNIRVD